MIYLSAVAFCSKIVTVLESKSRQFIRYFDFCTIQAYIERMKKMFLACIFGASLSVPAMACDFHEGDYFSRYDWPRVGSDGAVVHSTSTNDQSEEYSNVGERTQPDFRYNRSSSSATAANISWPSQRLQSVGYSSVL
jgi:hypothetical protein